MLLTGQSATFETQKISVKITFHTSAWTPAQSHRATTITATIDLLLWHTGECDQDLPRQLITKIIDLQMCPVDGATYVYVFYIISQQNYNVTLEFMQILRVVYRIILTILHLTLH